MKDAGNTIYHPGKITKPSTWRPMYKTMPTLLIYNDKQSFREPGTLLLSQFSSAFKVSEKPNYNHMDT